MLSFNPRVHPPTATALPLPLEASQTTRKSTHGCNPPRAEATAVLTCVTAGHGLANEPTCAARAILAPPPPRAPPRAPAPRRRREPELPAGGRHRAAPAAQLRAPGGVPNRDRPPVPHLPHAHPVLQLRLHRRARQRGVHAQDQLRQLRQGGDDPRRAGGPPRRRHLQRGRRQVAAPEEGRQPRVLHPGAARLQQRRVPRHRRGARGDRGRRGAGRRGDQGGHRGPADAVDAGFHLQGRVRRQPGLAVRVQQGGRRVRQGLRRRQRAGAVPLLRPVLEGQEAPQHLVGGGHEALGPHHQRVRVRRHRQEDRADGDKPSGIRQERGHPVEVPARAGARSRLLRQQVPAGHHPQLRDRRPRHHGGDSGLVPLRALQEPAHPGKDRAGGTRRHHGRPRRRCAGVRRAPDRGRHQQDAVPARRADGDAPALPGRAHRCEVLLLGRHVTGRLRCEERGHGELPAVPHGQDEVPVGRARRGVPAGEVARRRRRLRPREPIQVHRFPGGASHLLGKGVRVQADEDLRGRAALPLQI